MGPLLGWRELTLRGSRRMPYTLNWGRRSTPHREIHCRLLNLLLWKAGATNSVWNLPKKAVKHPKHKHWLNTNTMDVNMANKVTSFDLFLQNVYLSQLASCIAMGTIHSSYFFELSGRYKCNVLLCPLFIYGKPHQKDNIYFMYFPHFQSTYTFLKYLQSTEYCISTKL